MTPDDATIRAVPKRYDALPTSDPGELAAWFHRGARRGSLPLYLEGFAHTCGVMQTDAALERVAYEMIEDMRSDGVVYVETLICAMRNVRLSQEMAELAVDFRDRGGVGFDLAGEEGGFPLKKHVDAFHYRRIVLIYDVIKPRYARARAGEAGRAGWASYFDQAKTEHDRLIDMLHCVRSKRAEALA